MIPTIESIVEGLCEGTITKSQAVTWLYAHAEGATNELRDHFAGLAMQGINSQKDWATFEYVSVAEWAYDQADAMIEVRNREIK